MMDALQEITSFIPHREPFLWVDKIISVSPTEIVTEKAFPPDMAVFKGHYPDNPIMPGVLLCEAVFQSGALLMAKAGSLASDNKEITPVITRIKNAKFKMPVRPGDIARIKVRLIEVISSASYFKGALRVGGGIAVQVEFVCALIESKVR